MAGWGRNANLADVAAAPRQARYGRRSIVLALAALAVVAASVVGVTLLPAGTPEPAPTIATFAAFSAFCVVAPICHLLGIGFGIAGLFHVGDSKAASIVGIVLNIALLVLGGMLVYAGMQGMTAFT